MKGAQGRRGPLGGLLDRFSLDSLRAQRDRDKSKETIREITVRLAESSHREKPKPKQTYTKATKKPLAKRVAKRRGKPGRKNQAKRVRYLRREKARTSHK